VDERIDRATAFAEISSAAESSIRFCVTAGNNSVTMNGIDAALLRS